MFRGEDRIMQRKLALLLSGALLISVVPLASAQDGDSYTIAFVPGVNPDPFYITMSAGVNQAASDLGVEIIQQDPERFDVTVSAPIIEALVARGDIDAIVTAPNDREQSIPVLQEAHDAGIPVITVDTFIGDGDYENGEVTFPLSYIGSDNTQGGYIACSALADALGEGAQIYIQNVRPGTPPPTSARKAARWPPLTAVWKWCAWTTTTTAPTPPSSRRPPCCRPIRTSPACSPPIPSVRWVPVLRSRTLACPVRCRWRCSTLPRRTSATCVTAP
jgi:hypothetical protein